MSDIERVTLEEFQSMIKAQEVPIEDVKFECPICKSRQSANDLIAAGAGKDLDEVEKYLAFSCVGRFTGTGEYNSESHVPNSGCNWTLGGLFQLHKFEVETPDGHVHPRFRPVENA
ncbi:MAG: VVA0879 family protein [Pseudomonadota bacterium]